MHIRSTFTHGARAKSRNWDCKHPGVISMAFPVIGSKRRLVYDPGGVAYYRAAVSWPEAPAPARPSG